MQQDTLPASSLMLYRVVVSESTRSHVIVIVSKSTHFHVTLAVSRVFSFVLGVVVSEYAVLCYVAVSYYGCDVREYTILCYGCDV